MQGHLTYKASKSCGLATCQLFLLPHKYIIAKQFPFYSHGVLSVLCKYLQKTYVLPVFPVGVTSRLTHALVSTNVYVRYDVRKALVSQMISSKINTSALTAT